MIARGVRERAAAQGFGREPGLVIIWEGMRGAFFGSKGVLAAELAATLIVRPFGAMLLGVRWPRRLGVVEEEVSWGEGKGKMWEMWDWDWDWDWGIERGDVRVESAVSGGVRGLEAMEEEEEGAAVCRGEEDRLDCGEENGSDIVGVRE